MIAARLTAGSQLFENLKGLNLLKSGFFGSMTYINSSKLTAITAMPAISP